MFALIELVYDPIEGSRSAPIRISNQHQSIMGWQWGQDPWKRSLYIQVSDLLCYKPFPIIYTTSLLETF